MTPASPFLRHFSHLHISRLLLVFAVVLAIVIAAGCGGGSQPKTPVLSGNTEVTVLLSSAANDQLQLFQIGFSNLTPDRHLTLDTGGAVGRIYKY